MLDGQIAISFQHWHVLTMEIFPFKPGESRDTKRESESCLSYLVIIVRCTIPTPTP